MSRALSRRERALAAVLAVLLVALVYYLLVYQPVQEELSSVETRQLDIAASIEVERAKTVKLEQMRGELALLEQNGAQETAPMARFNNEQNVITELSAILAAATDYDLSFSPLVTDGGLVRRSIGMSFGCADYADARDILEQLYSCRYRCQIGDFSLSARTSAAAGGGGQARDLTLNPVQVSLTVTFYEMIEE